MNLIRLEINASNRLKCYFSDTSMQQPVEEYVVGQLHFTAKQAVHDSAMTQIYQDYYKGNFRLVYGIDDWIEGFWFFAWNEISDIYVQKIYDRFCESFGL